MQAGEALRVVEELTDPMAGEPPGRDTGDDEAQRFARQIVDRLKRGYAQARFEYLRIAAAPRFIHRLRTELDKHLDRSRAVLEWRALDLVAFDDEAVRQMGPCPEP